MKISELLAKRGTAVDAFMAAKVKLDGYKPPAKPKNDAEKTAAAPILAAHDADQADYERSLAEVKFLDDAIAREKAVQEVERGTAATVTGQDDHAHRVHAQVKTDIYTSKAVAEARGLTTNAGLTLGGICRMLGAGRGHARDAAEIAAKLYGEGHPVTKSLVAGIGGAGGFIVPPEYINEIIELLRPMAVVRSANPRTMPMPNGTMTLPAQTSAAVASYSGEISAIKASQQTLGQIIASYKKLTALVPVSNDLMRYADPAADAFVRDDLTKIIALREDLAFMMGDGTQQTPRGFLSFANEYAIQQGGSAGAWLAASSGNSTAASGGNFITSTAAYTLATAAAELGGLMNKLDTANVPDSRRVWFMHPRSYNYLFNVQNSLGLYVFRDELMTGKLLTYPVKRSTQLPVNIDDATSANVDCSFVMLVEMTDAMILDSMTMELFISREGGYVDGAGNQVNLVPTDQTLIRAIAEHDFQMRHSASVAVAQFVRWAPAIS